MPRKKDVKKIIISSIMAIVFIYFSFVDWAASPYLEVEEVTYNYLGMKLFGLGLSYFTFFQLILSITAIPILLSLIVNNIESIKIKLNYFDALSLTLLFMTLRYI